MFKLLPTYRTSPFFYDIVLLLIRYRVLFFSESQNPVSVFLEQLENSKIKVISAIKDNEFLGFLALYDFHKISDKKFYCYMYGAMNRHCAKEVDMSFKVIFGSLKSQGCIGVRLETRKYNLPMRMCARRLGFNKIGILSKSSYNNGKFEDNILYEKIFV